MSITSRFRTEAGAAQFLAAYDTTLALSGVVSDSIEVNTGFGLTHVTAAGSPEAPPLVLLHGAQISSPVWYANLKPLSQHFRVYAPDAVDQMGRSMPSKKLQTPQECVAWLGEVLDGLHLDEVMLIGHSQGGWMALNMAVNAPHRVKRLVLLSPSGSLSRVHWKLLMHMLPVLVRPTKKMFYWSFQSMTTMSLGEYHPLAEQFMIGALNFKPQELSMGAVSVFSDVQLRGIKTPTLLLIGEQDNTCHPAYDLQRACRLIPYIEAELIAGGGHLFPVDQADATNARLLRFLVD